jgi:hypothetical protein
MRASLKSPLAVRRVVSKSVFGQVQNGIELGLRIATGLLIAFAMGLVLLAAEVRSGTRVEALNNLNTGDIQMPARGPAVNEHAGALISMMARSPSRSNRRPDYAGIVQKRAASHVLVAEAAMAAFASALASIRRCRHCLATENGNATYPNRSFYENIVYGR